MIPLLTLLFGSLVLTGCSASPIPKTYLLYEFPEEGLDHVGGLAWSPQGDRILLHTLRKGQTREEYGIFSLKEGRLEPLDLPPMEDSQNFSPEGREIIFSDGHSIYEYDIENQRLEPLEVTTPGDSSTLLGAVYSPNGLWIAFFRGGERIYLAPREDGEARLLASGLKSAYWIRWSSDREKLFIWHLEGPTVAQVEIATGKVTDITRGHNVSPLPSGNRIVYLDNRRIFLRDLDKKKNYLISQERNVRDLAVNPDGQTIAFIVEDRGRFFLKAQEVPAFDEN